MASGAYGLSTGASSAVSTSSTPRPARTGPQRAQPEAPARHSARCHRREGRGLAHERLLTRGSTSAYATSVSVFTAT